MEPIRRVAVLGAGTMGSQIAAHLANARIPCILLDRASAQPRADSDPPAASHDNLARLGVERALKATPAAFFSAKYAEMIKTGSFEADLELLRGCDWVIEAIAENLELKRGLLKRAEPFIAPHAIVSSNTSGISLAAIAEGFSFLPRWLGTHFFNPPRYMKLLEVIPTPATQPGVLQKITQFGNQVLGKGIVIAKDTPNFIANRIGVFFHLLAIALMREEGFSIEEVDALTGPAIGLPKSATFRTADIVGLDVMADVVKNLRQSLPDDEERERLHLPAFMQRMIKLGLLGQKAGGGFYKRAGRGAGGESEILTLDLGTFAYRPRQKPEINALETAKSAGDARLRVRRLYNEQGPAGAFYRKLFGRLFHYAGCRIPEISDDLTSVDRAMKWGFNWEYGPFELCDAVGIEAAAAQWEALGMAAPPLVTELLAAGKRSFYQECGGEAAVFDLHRAAYAAIPEPAGILFLPKLLAAGREVKRNPGASLIDLGDGVVCLDFHSKMNTIGPDAIQMIHFGLKMLDESFDAMVIGNQGPHFSAGANLLLLLLSIQERDWDEIRRAVRAFQAANMALKYAPKPVVAAPFKLTLGGGVETSLHCARRVAAAESYMGLVEAGVGLIPAGGGTKEMLLRAMNSVAPDEDADPFLPLKAVFKNIGMAVVSTSAAEAVSLGYLSPDDPICIDQDRQIALAKQTALNMIKQGFRPRLQREEIRVLGAPALAKMKLALHLLRRGEYISDHDLMIGVRLAKVLAGGDFSSVQRVPEQHLLDLELEAFLSLCGQKKTADRIQHMLKTGKPLRN